MLKGAGSGQKLYQTAKKLIPGGTQLLSKRPELFLPGLWPAYYRKASGCSVWDLDGIRYTDMSYMGIGSCILGYADPDVNAAVKQAVDTGSMSTLNATEEVELAQLLIKLHPWAAMVRYARSGGESMAMAVRVARSFTGKDVVLFCGYHGWHDWYLAANLGDDSSLDGHLLPGLAPRGVPRSLKKSAFPFHYNDYGEFEALLKRHSGKIAAVVMEPLRNFAPKERFLERIREACSRSHVVLIFDEITSGWRLAKGGAHLNFGVNPDICVFAKAMSNGFPMAAVLGTRAVMQAAQETFISSTYWTERVGPAAALATIGKLVEKSVYKHLIAAGRLVQAGWKKTAKSHALPLEISGMYPLSHFSFKDPDAQLLKTLFTQLMLERGFLATNSFYASLAHTDGHINSYLGACDEVFAAIALARKRGGLRSLLKGEVCHDGFKRLT